MKALALVALAASCLAAMPAAGETLRGVVVGIADGDTLTLLTPSNRPVRIRLAEIDAPELHGQPFGRAAKSALSSLAYRRQASAEVITRDRYGRTVALVDVAGVNINAAMVEKGLAWAYRRYETDPLYARLQALAQRNRTGLWRATNPAPVPPWEFRRANAGQSAWSRR